LIYFVFNLEIDFDLTTRDRLLVIFATVGINARLADLVAGGRTLVVLCVIAAVFVFIQNIVGTVGALAFGMPSSGGGHRLSGLVGRPRDRPAGAVHCD
jgi:ESS family glutamate:Na+ symporter